MAEDPAVCSLGAVAFGDRGLNADIPKTVLIRRIDQSLYYDLKRRTVGQINDLVYKPLFFGCRSDGQNVPPGDLHNKSVRAALLDKLHCAATLSAAAAFRHRADSEDLFDLNHEAVKFVVDLVGCGLTAGLAARLAAGRRASGLAAAATAALITVLAALASVGKINGSTACALQKL